PPAPASSSTTSTAGSTAKPGSGRRTPCTPILSTPRRRAGTYRPPTSPPEGAAPAVPPPVRNPSAAARPVTVRARVRDPRGGEVATLEGTVRVEAGARGEVTASAHVEDPQLWSLTEPRLYTVDTEAIVDG